MFVSSRSNSPCFFVYGCAGVFVNGDLWVVQGSWFAMIKEDLGNLVHRANDNRVEHGAYATLGIRVLVKMRGSFFSGKLLDLYYQTETAKRCTM